MHNFFFLKNLNCNVWYRKKIFKKYYNQKVHNEKFFVFFLANKIEIAFSISIKIQMSKSFVIN